MNNAELRTAAIAAERSMVPPNTLASLRTLQQRVRAFSQRHALANEQQQKLSQSMSQLLDGFKLS